jgi:hypothetical protein
VDRRERTGLPEERVAKLETEKHKVAAAGASMLGEQTGLVLEHGHSVQRQAMTGGKLMGAEND